jgi:hypothetical protein
MSKSTDLTGMKFGKLNVIKRVNKANHLKTKGDYWLCKCDCGNDRNIILPTGSLVHENTKSCGCLNKERIINYNKNTKKKYNTYDLSNEYGIGYTSKGEEFYFDLEDYDKIKDIYWMSSDKGYIISPKKLENGKSYNIFFHRLIMNCPQNMSIDHVNGSETTHDNRKKNLRICTNQENSCNSPIQSNNTSGKTGVYWSKKYNIWISQINYKNKKIHLGYFKDFNDAVNARINAEIKYFGEYRNNYS